MNDEEERKVKDRRLKMEAGRKKAERVKKQEEDLPGFAVGVPV